MASQLVAVVALAPLEPLFAHTFVHKVAHGAKPAKGKTACSTNPFYHAPVRQACAVFPLWSVAGKTKKKEKKYETYLISIFLAFTTKLQPDGE